jgi:hypothetical protein
MTDECFGAVIALIEAAYGLEFSPERKRAWFLLLGDLADDEAQRAVIRLCRTSSYPPKPADIIRAARGGPADPDVALEDEAELAISHLERHIRDDVAVDLGPALNAVVRDLGGPDAVVAMMTVGEWRYRRPDAKRLYRAHRRRGISPGDAAPMLPVAAAEAWNARYRTWPAHVLYAADGTERFPEPPAVRAVFTPPAEIPGLQAPQPRPALASGAGKP